MKKVILILTTIILLSCKTNNDDEHKKLPTLKIGFSGPLSGHYKKYGTSILEGIQDSIIQYENFINIEIIILDDKLDYNLGINNSKKLIEENVDIVIGPVTSGGIDRFVPLYSDDKIITITTSAANPKFNQNEQYKYLFRTGLNDSNQSKKINDFVKSKKYENVCIIYENYDHWRNLAEELKSSEFVFENIYYDAKSGKLYDEKDKTKNINPILKKVDLIIYCGYFQGFANIYKYVRKNLSKNTSFLCSDGVTSDHLFKYEIEYHNVYSVSNTELAYYKELHEIYDTYEIIHKEKPGPFYCVTYATTDLIVKILLENANLFQLNKSERNTKIVELLKSKEIDSLFGKIRFDNRGDINLNGHNILKIEKDDYILESF